jgi:hypothetical protein
MPHEGHDPLLHRHDPRRVVGQGGLPLVDMEMKEDPAAYAAGSSFIDAYLGKCYGLSRNTLDLKTFKYAFWVAHTGRIGKWGENPPRPRHCERVADGTMPLTMRSGRRRSGDDPQARRPAQRVIGWCSSRWGVPGDLCSAGRRSLLSQRTSSSRRAWLPGRFFASRDKDKGCVSLDALHCLPWLRLLL